MKFPIAAFDSSLGRLSKPGLLLVAICGAVMVGFVDYITGYEFSVALFYLGPISIAAWYAGPGAAIATALISCGAWYLSDFAAGHHYSHPAIPVWNALVRLGVFLVTGLLLVALRRSYLDQQQLARTDALTGLHSRRAFEDELTHDLALARRRGSALTLVYVDVDNFKAVNDTGGHAKGDQVLREIGQTLKHLMRAGDTVARIGGDEFALVLPETDTFGAQQVVTKLNRALQDVGNASDLALTCSIGVVTVTNAAASPEDAIAAADKLMYEVKHEGKGKVAYGELDEVVRRRAEPDVQWPTRVDKCSSQSSGTT